jgi:hypothetical protein
MLHNNLQPHIHNILTHAGGAIAIDLFFKNEHKFRIISVYLSSTSTSDRKATQDQAIKWIQQAITLDLHPVIMGDFNINDDNLSSSAIKYQLLNYLHSINMYDLANYTSNTLNTWQSSRYQNRIDYIWAYETIIPYLYNFDIDNPSSSTDSDHQILTSSWSFPFAKTKNNHKHKCKRRVYNYKSMSKENWEEFTNAVYTNMVRHQVPTTTNTTESLEKTWHKIYTSIINAALKHIPNKKYTTKNFFHAFTPAATKLHKDLKTVGHIIHRVRRLFSHKIQLPDNIQSLIDQINNTHNFAIDPPPTQLSDLQTWLNNTRNYWKTLYNARNLENAQHLRQHINTATNKRCEQLITQPTKMIKSILNRHTDVVLFHNIKTDTNIITEPKDIKQHITNHFDKWTAHQPYDENIFNSEWYNEYQPIPHIQTTWYNSILEDISIDEIIQTIKQLPNNKACGPSGISYEMIKHLEIDMICALTALLNRCLQTHKIPKQWKCSRIYPISKKTTFNGDLNNTRPISLIEHTKKLYTKIITNRLTHVLTKHPILNPHNYVALPGNSTNSPIHILNNFIEDAHCTEKDIWILSQDMSKAYDSVNLSLLVKALQRLQMPTQLVNIIANLLQNQSNQVITNLGLSPLYTVQDGIDQGETITPLLWRIYYDPLINYINKTYKGYTSSTS